MRGKVEWGKVFLAVIILWILSALLAEWIVAGPKPKKEKGIVWITYDGNDSMIYQAKFRLSDIDSVMNGLKDHSEPMEERYIAKPWKTPKTKGH